MKSNQPHVQSSAFWRLFPNPANDIEKNCVLSNLFTASCFEKDLEFNYLSCEFPDFDRNSAIRGGIDYSVRLNAHFRIPELTDEEFFISLGKFPVPDENGEFIIGGN